MRETGLSGHEAVTGADKERRQGSAANVVPKMDELAQIPLTGPQLGGWCRKTACAKWTYAKAMNYLFIVLAGLIVLVAAFLLAYEVWILGTERRVTHRRRRPGPPNLSRWG